jgi:hypothetical protein
MTDIKELAAELAPALQSIEPVKGGVELAAAPTVQVKDVHDGAYMR